MEDLQISTIDSLVDTRSTSNNHPNHNCDVFISHRGPDVKNTFAGYLYRELCAHGLQPFLDREVLRAGEYMDPQIEGAIESAYVHIIILSPGFADSRWCLDELLLMLKKTGDIIIPVFFNVKPSELRWAKDGRYTQALTKHERTGRYECQTLENWRKALKDVSYRVGFELDTYNGDQVKLLEKVVECVLKNCRKAALQEATSSLPVLQKNSWSLTNLRSLDLSGCVSLPTLSDSLECFSNLETLNISGCPSLQELPDSFARLKNLQELNISGCERLRELPEFFGCLKNLKTIDLSSCKSLERLPNSFGSLTNLEVLDLSRCGSLQELTDSFGYLSNLRDLHLSDCESLQRLPDSFGYLRNLRNLDLSGCRNLQGLSGCRNLQGLSVLQARDKQHGINNTQTAPFSPRFRPPIRSSRYKAVVSASRCKTVASASAAYNSRLVGAFEFAPFSPRFRPPIRSSRCKTVVSASRCKTVASASAAYNSRLVGAYEYTPMVKISNTNCGALNMPRRSKLKL